MSDPPPPPPPPSSAPPPGPAGPRRPEEALEAVTDALENVVAPAAHRPGSLAALLTVAAPGMGHVYLEVGGQRRTKAFALLAATVAVVVLSCFVSFPIALVIYLAAVGFGLADLRDEVAPMQQSRASGGPLGMFSDLGRTLSWRLVVVAGVLLAVSLLLPWYRDSAGGVTVAASGRAVLSVIDWVLAVTGIGAALLGVVNLTQGTARRPPVAGPPALIVVAAAGVALALVVFRLLLTTGGPELGIERSFGLLLAFASAVLLAGGAAGAATSKS